MRSALLAVIVVLLTLAGTCAMANEIGFIEEFSLAEDRAAPLSRLIPGTEDYHYYHCLHALNTEDYATVGEHLEKWVKNFGRTARVQEIENRLALLTYSSKPKQTLEYLTRVLNLTYPHQREVPDKKRNLATGLDQKYLRFDWFSEKALARHPHSLDGFEDTGLWGLDAGALSKERLEDLLRRLTRPDYPNLAALVVKNLKDDHSQGFGSLSIHSMLTLAQMDQCAKLMPKLTREADFVLQYVKRLQPAQDVDLALDDEEMQAYLDRLWAYVSGLAPAFNSLKAHVLYHRLDFDRHHDTYDKERFLTYLQLPRYADYMDDDYLDKRGNSNNMADLNEDFSLDTRLATINNDEPLVRDYLEHFFLTEKNYKAYQEYIEESWLEECFAQAKILSGQGDREKWFAMLPPSMFQELKDRVILDFALSNKRLFLPGQEVALDLDVKNVDNLIIKIYEINTYNYYSENGRAINTDIDLDGLVANTEMTRTYTSDPLSRVRRHFDFPELKDRGVYVVEFIGGGKSSRALIRIGSLRFIQRVGAAGHVFTVLDEQNNKIEHAAIQVQGHRYEADEHGQIAVPFSTQPGSQQIILMDGDFACLAEFQHAAEEYHLSAGIYVDREELLSGSTATVAIRPKLTVQGRPASLKLLERPSLIITSLDHDGVATTMEVKNIELKPDQEFLYEFRVPDRLASINFELAGTVQVLTKFDETRLTVSQNFALNSIAREERVRDLHLSKVGQDWVLDLLGRNGEPVPDSPVNLEVKHRDFRDILRTTLQTDAEGRVNLGPCLNVERVTATDVNAAQTWTLPQDEYAYPDSINALAGEDVNIPYMGTADKALPMEISLMEVRDGEFVRDMFEACSVKGGFLTISGLEPGEYDLALRTGNDQYEESISITVLGERMGMAPKKDLAWLLGPTRMLEVLDEAPLAVTEVEQSGSEIRVQLANTGENVRMHVLADRYLPPYSAFDALSNVTRSLATEKPAVWARSVYLSGRDIGDEYRYILERRYAAKYPGNMLKRPELLLSPWEVRKTSTDTHDAEEGESWAPASEPDMAPAPKPEAAPPPGVSGITDSGDLDYLASSSVIFYNLEPDKNGVVSIPRKDLGDRALLTIVAVDDNDTTCRRVALEDAPDRPKTRDLRLTRGLNPDKHYTEQKRISVIEGGKPLVLEDARIAHFETYDSLASVYTLYQTLSHDSNLAEFGFILTWPDMDQAEKMEKYSKYACHELNFFLFKKDPEFFKTAVQPFIANKKDKTFLDHWLLAQGKGADSAEAKLLKQYLEPWRYNRLNIVERILLSRIAGDDAARHVKDLYNLLPPDRETADRLFEIALKGSALDAAAKDGDMMLDSIVSGEEMEADMALYMNGGGDAPPPAMERADVSTMDVKRKSMAKEAKADEAKQMAPGASRGGFDDMGEDMARRERMRQLYRKMDKTAEFAENNYHHRLITEQNQDLVTVNAFWRDLAAYDVKKPFYSVNLAECAGNFTEMMFALAFLDLPFKAGEHMAAVDGPKFTLTAATPLVAYHKEILPAKQGDAEVPVLVSQNFYRLSDRYRYVDNERYDKFVTEEFLTHTVYGCQVVITNPTSSPLKLELLLETPRGSIPVLGSHATRGLPVDLPPFQTYTLEYHFYFPESGDFEHFPVHVAREGELAAFVKPFGFHVVDTPSTLDTESWDHVSQHAKPAQVLKFLDEHNVFRLDLTRMAWRMKDKDFYAKALALLDKRHAYDQTLWSYSVLHGDAANIREFLRHQTDFANQCGLYLKSPLLDLNPVEDTRYEHLEYSPLVNARAHRLGKKQEILNDRFNEQYHRLMSLLSYKTKLDDADRMAVIYYLLLQDRIEEALAQFDRVKPENLGTTLQYDYMAAYLALYTGEYDKARQLTDKYKDYPVDRWRKLFAAEAAQLDEIQSMADAATVDDKDRTQAQTELAATEPGLEFTVESGKVTLTYQNIAEARVNFYLMDIELLFSRNPFVTEYTGQFSSIRPNGTMELTLDETGTLYEFNLPDEFKGKNVMIEIAAAGVKKAQAYYANTLNAQVVENYGQVRVTRLGDGAPLPLTYVKVYARLNTGDTVFYKDGYTDARGRFDYTSLNTDMQDQVERFSLLILSEQDGAVVREAAPPKQ